MFSRLYEWLADPTKTVEARSSDCPRSPSSVAKDIPRGVEDAPPISLQHHDGILEPDKTELPSRTLRIDQSSRSERVDTSDDSVVSSTTSALMRYFLPTMSSSSIGDRSLTRKSLPTAKVQISKRLSPLMQTHLRFVDFQVIWQTTDLIGRVRISVNPYICLALPDIYDDLSRLIGRDEFVTGPLEVGYLKIDFPLRQPTKRLIRPKQPSLGFRRAELCICVATEYQELYDAERVSSADHHVVSQASSQNGLGGGSGKYGIFGYALVDLFLTSITWNPKNNEFHLCVEG